MVSSQFDGFRGLHALLERAVRVEERRLRDVFCVRVVAEHRERVAIDLGDVRAVEVVDLARGEMAGLGYGHAFNGRRAPDRPQPTSHILNTANAQVPRREASPGSHAETQRSPHDPDTHRSRRVPHPFRAGGPCGPAGGQGQAREPRQQRRGAGPAGRQERCEEVQGRARGSTRRPSRRSTARTPTRRTPSASASPAR